MSRRYSEEDARRIFARAAERQSRTAPSDRGLSLTELEEAARAAGLDPALVASAAAELEAPGPPRRLAGVPVEARVSRVVPTALTDDVWTAIVSDARAQFRGTGTAGQLGRVREWSHVSGGAKNGITTHLSAEPVAGGLRLTLSQSIRDLVFAFHISAAISALMAVLFTSLALAGVDPELWIPAGMMLGMTLLFGMGSRVGAGLWQRSREARFESLLDRFERIARDQDGGMLAFEDAASEPLSRTAERSRRRS